MALYWGPPDAPKDEHHLFALAEFKRGNLEAAHGNGDRARLCRLLKEIDSCQFGIVCGWVKTRYAAYQKQCAERAGDRWYQSAVPTGGDCVFCARVFSVTADAGLDTAA